jgi:hypothetical protein
VHICKDNTPFDSHTCHNSINIKINKAPYLAPNATTYHSTPENLAIAHTFVLCKQSRSVHYPIHMRSLYFIVVLVLLLYENRQNFNGRIQTQSLSPLPSLEASRTNTRLQKMTSIYIQSKHDATLNQ